jgi:streptomycin 6-kinase
LSAVVFALGPGSVVKVQDADDREGEHEAAALAPIIRGRELGHSHRDVLWRLDRLTSELGLDRDRARGWAFAHTVAWGFGEAGRVLSTHVDAAGWLVPPVN